MRAIHFHWITVNLRDLDAAVTSAIFTAATEHCGFTGEEVAELEKNFDAAGGES
jgi:hypothetical protein